MRTGHLLSLAAVVLFSLAIAGCNTNTSVTTPAPNASSQGHDHDGHDHAGHDHDGHGHDGHGHAHGDEDIDPNKIALNLAKLSEEDRVLAEKQEICLVGGELLGSMGVPEKVDVDGTLIFMCCRACEGEILDNKEKYIALVNGTESEESDDPGDSSNDDSGEGDSSE